MPMIKFMKKIKRNIYSAEINHPASIPYGPTISFSLEHIHPATINSIIDKHNYNCRLQYENSKLLYFELTRNNR